MDQQQQSKMLNTSLLWNDEDCLRRRQEDEMWADYHKYFADENKIKIGKQFENYLDKEKKEDLYEDEEKYTVEEPTMDANQKLEEGLSAVQNVVYQLVGGLFNQQTQNNILRSHVNAMYMRKIYDVSDEVEEINFPTTRQGDVNKKEIDNLKHQVARLEETVGALVGIIQDKIGYETHIRDP